MKLEEHGANEGYALHRLSQWIDMLEKKAATDEDAARGLAAALTRISDASCSSLCLKGDGKLLDAAILAAYRMTHAFESIARSQRGAKAIRRFAAAWTHFPALLPVLEKDRAAHLNKLAQRIKAGTKAVGTKKGATRKSHSLETPINRFVSDLLNRNRGVIEYRGKQYPAPWAWPDVNGLKISAPLPCPPYSDKTLRLVLDEFVMPFLRAVLKDDIGKLAYMPEFKAVLTRYKYRKVDDPLQPSQGQAHRDEVAREVWTHVRKKIYDAIHRMKLVRT